MALTTFAQGDRTLTRDTSSKAAEKRVALVIGNGRYARVSPLDNPVNDAADMALTLQGLGFEVIKGTDTNLVQMRRLIRQFGERLEQQKGVGLFYYAGHGVEVRGKNFLVPVDADIAREVETEDYAIDLNSVMRQMDAAGNGFNIVILDACRNNPFSRGWNRSGDTGGLANVNAPTGTYIAFAAAPGSTASDGKGGRNGVFTGALVKHLKRPGLKLEEVFKSTREDVMTVTGNKQVPWDSSSVKGEFYFNQKPSANSALPVTASRPPRSETPQEKEAWELVKGSGDLGYLRAYLKEFPDGFHADAATAMVDDLLWASVKSSVDPSKVQQYLEEFPDGNNAAAARIRARQLESKAPNAGNPQPVDKVDSGTLEGTVWTAISPGGDKRYQFDFLGDGKVTCSYYYKGWSAQVFNGTWKFDGKTVTMDLKKMGPSNATIAGEKISGSWWNGKYSYSGERFRGSK